MRWRERVAILMCIGAGATTAGCPFNALDDCERNFALDCFWDRLASSTGAGGDGGTPAGCVPSEDNKIIADGCGLFVSSSLGDDGGDGSKAKPFKSLATAVEKAGSEGKPVYACAEELVGSVSITSSIALYGGLDCSDGWTYVGATTKSVLVGDVDAVALTLAKSAGGAAVVDFSIQAPDAMKEGASSIAVVAEEVTAELVRCELVAGNGAKGAAGAAGDPNGMSATSGAAGNAGKDACSDLDGTPGPDAMLLGGASSTNDCGASEVSVGGRGGDGNTLFGDGGSVGQSGTAGQAGAGEPAAGAWDCLPGSGQGTSGSSGEAGMPGLGAMGPGAISAVGFAGTSGGAGTSGKAGQGGGGGGGAKGGMICPGGVAGSGASGGSGGAEFVRCELVAGNGAKGSAGAAGDPNGASATAGAAGNNGKNACSDLDALGGPDTTLPGGAQVTNDCGSSGVSIGAQGGDGNVLNGGGGDVGQTGTAGQAGAGEPAAGMWSCIKGQGQIGSPGEVGSPGVGATGPGAISATGFMGTSGGAGASGKAGQGGGGGGGAKGGMICPGGVAGSGASGGSGGAGGCGGQPSQGGGPGGASIALVSLKASITLTDCTLATGKGGDGGAGGDLQPGGSGGDPGKGGKGAGGANDACSGGQGGKGGNGGPGGGGLGGPSLGIAFQGNPPERQGKTVVTAGTPGAGGPGGSVNVAMNAGEAGKTSEEQEFAE
jgi:hypothetical protein